MARRTVARCGTDCGAGSREGIVAQVDPNHKAGSAADDFSPSGGMAADIGRTARTPIVGGSREGPSLSDVASGPAACGADAVATTNPASPVAAVAAIAKHRVKEQAVGKVVVVADIVGAVVQRATAQTWLRQEDQVRVARRERCCYPALMLNQSGLESGKPSENMLQRCCS